MSQIPVRIPYNERDPLLLNDPSLKTPPPSYYASTTTTDGKETTLPSYQEAATRNTGIQYSDEVRFLYPEPRPSTYSGLAALAFFCCCCSPLACIALYYSARVKEYYESGDYDRCKQASRRTLTCSVLAIMLGLVLVFLVSSVLFCVFYSECKSQLFH